MIHLIDKDTLITEIEKLKKLLPWGSCASQISMECNCKNEAYNDVLSILDTLEVKEVNLDKSARCYLLNEHKSSLNEVLHQCALKTEMQYHQDIENAYKAGFELGLKAAQKGE